MLYGVSYYHEYQPFDRLDEDVRMMADAGINYARIGDSIWALCEPAEGRFELDWLRPVLDALHQAGIAVVLTTPTYAIPPWLARRHPEVMIRRADGSSVPFGARQNMDVSHPGYRFYAERITRKLLQRYASHPSVIGFQVDNETGTSFAQNPGVFDRFVQHLKAEYGDVQRLNELWGLNYWSHRLGQWEDLWTPAGNTNPGYDLAWRRFNAMQVTEFLAWQRAIVADYADERQFVTQDLVGLHGRGEPDRYQVGAIMDVIAENFPHGTQDALLHPQPEGNVPGAPGHTGAGPLQLYQRSDMAYGAKRKNFFVTEMNPISIGFSDNTFPCYDGQWRMAAYTCISRGADMVAYWHWHSLHFGHETYSHGIVNHDLEPNRNYHEVSAIGHELAEHGELLTGSTPESEVAFLYSYDSRYALDFLPCLKNPDGSTNRRSYQTIFDRCYRSFFDARAQSIVLPTDAELDDFPVVVAPALYVADDATLDRLRAYAEAGGHLVTTFRSGYADEHGRARWQRAPGPLRAAVGAGYNLYSNLVEPVPVTGTEALAVPDDAMAEGWADELEPEGAETLLGYRHPHFGRFPAVVSQPYGSGRVTYLGTLPNPSLGRAIASWVLEAAGVRPLGADLPESVRVNRSTTRDGHRLWWVSNWSWDSHEVRIPAAGTALFGGEPTDGTLRLGAWDIQAIVER